MADAWHHRSDSLSSIGAFIGILGARVGFPVLDAAASVIICIFIGKAAIDIFRDAMDKMVDKSCDDKIIKQMEEIILERKEVKQIDLLKTRMFGAKIYVDVEISLDENLLLKESHEVAEQIHDKIEQQFPQVKHCMVHVNPFKE